MDFLIIQDLICGWNDLQRKIFHSLNAFDTLLFSALFCNTHLSYCISIASLYFWVLQK